MKLLIWLFWGGMLISPSVYADSSASGWVPADPAGGYSKYNPATVDRITFGNQFQNQGMDQWCDRLPLIVPLSQDFFAQMGRGSALVGGTFSGTRQFLRYPDGSLALNDTLEVKFQTGYAQTVLKKIAGATQRALGVYGGVSVDGQTIVTRPLHTANSCSQMKRLLNVLDFKTVLPLNARRISKMEVGELWEIPLVYQISFEPLDAAQVVTTPLAVAPFSTYFAIGLSKTADPTVTLFRKGQHDLRLKIHFDQFSAVNASGGAVIGPIPATDIGTPGIESLLSGMLPNIISNPVLKLLTREVDDYLAAQIAVLMSGQRGRQIFLEYRLDPDNQEEMRNLAKLLKGDLGVLAAMKDLMTTWKNGAEDKDVQKTLQALRQKHTQNLRVPESLSGLDSYKDSLKTLNFSIPFLFNYSGSVAHNADHYVIVAPKGFEFYSYKSQRQSNWGFFKPPIMGSSLRHNRSQSVQSMILLKPNARTKTKAEQLVVYNRETGILRLGDIHQELSRINSLMGSIGSLGEKVGTETKIPEELEKLTQGSEHKGYVELSVILTSQAIHQIVSASASAVFRAFQLSLSGSDRAVFDYALKYSRISEDGALHFKRAFARHLDELNLFDPTRKRLEMVLSWARGLAHQVHLLISDLKEIRSLSPQQQSKEFLNVLDGSSHWFESYSGYGGVMRILLRLAPQNGVAADLFFHVDKKKTDSSNPTKRYLFNQGLLSAASLRAVSAVERAFMPPTPLND